MHPGNQIAQNIVDATRTQVLVIGAGPAGLMAAEVLAAEGILVTLCDAKPSFGRKFLMAGKSGLNVTKNENLEQMMPRFEGAQTALRPMIEAFDASAVQAWMAGLGQESFIGSSGRVFPKAMKASPLMRAWLKRLDATGVQRRVSTRWVGWDDDGVARFETPSGPERINADATVLALGGASWARLGSDGEWSTFLKAVGVDIAPFAPANAAVTAAWSSHMAPHFGTPLKTVVWRAGALVSKGEAILSATGLEGGGLYNLTPALRQGAPLTVDLVPDRDAQGLNAALAGKPAKLRLAHWLKKTLRLPPAKVALFFEMWAADLPARADWVRSVKEMPLRYSGLRPMDEAISTAGGVPFEALTKDLMLKRRAGVFCAGEMLDWEAPTGGYLITACLATGRRAAHGVLRYLENAA